jgi:predicted amidohydrolase
MSRPVRLAVVQPPAVSDSLSHESMRVAALDLLDRAGAEGADLVCLPEYVNAMGRDDDFWAAPPSADDETLVRDVCERAVRHGMNVVLPLLEGRENRRYNSALIIDRAGSVVGRYDKTHLTAVERDDQQVTAGDTYPVFELDVGRVGVMTCYDGHFPEPARILALAGAEVILFPALQRAMSAEELELQVRCRAIDNCVVVARSSYGWPDDMPWTPGMMAGKSCIVDHEGTVLTDAGPRVGVAAHTLDLARPRNRRRSFGGQIGDARDVLRQDRRPETYGPLLDG